MRGRRVERRFGWDTHGLPAELEAMSQLGIKTKEEILELGIETFNAKCRESVLKYTGEWREYVTRQARWVDFDNDYKTLNPTFMESVIWAFKNLYDKGLVYEGFRVPAVLLERPDPAEQPRAADGRRRLQEPAGPGGDGRLPPRDRRARPDLDDDPVDPADPTSRWPCDPDIDYVVVESDFTGRTERYLLAEARLAAYARELGEDAAERVVERLKGSRPRRAPLHPAVLLLPRPREVARRARRRLRHHRRRHRHRAHRAGLR